MQKSMAESSGDSYIVISILGIDAENNLAPKSKQSISVYWIVLSIVAE